MIRLTSAACLALALGWVTACVDRLPDQDLRILNAVPAAKMSADILWQEYQTDAAAADAAYRGKAIEITGTITSVGPEAPGQSYVIFGQGDTQKVRANLLDEQAHAILSAIPENRLLTLRCFCQGLVGTVLLKSCIRP